MYDGELSAFLRQPKAAPNSIGWKTKRIFDFFIASFTLLLLSPLFAIVVLLIKLTDRGPVFSSRIYVGQGGRNFACLKFRSTVINFDKPIQILPKSDPSAEGDWEPSQKLVNDPRATAVGKILRRSSLDELPRLINVIRGEMSLVGPRPIGPSEVMRYGDKLDWYHRVRPGLTGLWRVSGRNGDEGDRCFELEANYVRNWRFSTDLMLLLRTLGMGATQIGNH